jgi:hypothetical protein
MVLIQRLRAGAWFDRTEGGRNKKVATYICTESGVPGTCFRKNIFGGLLADGLGSSARVVGQVSTSRLHCHVSAGFGYKDHFRVADHPEGGQTGQYKGVSRYLFAETSYKPTWPGSYSTHRRMSFSQSGGMKSCGWALGRDNETNAIFFLPIQT